MRTTASTSSGQQDPRGGEHRACPPAARDRHEADERERGADDQVDRDQPACARDADEVRARLRGDVRQRGLGDLGARRLRHLVEPRGEHEVADAERRRAGDDAGGGVQRPAPGRPLARLQELGEHRERRDQAHHDAVGVRVGVEDEQDRRGRPEARLVGVERAHEAPQRERAERQEQRVHAREVAVVERDRREREDPRGRGADRRAGERAAEQPDGDDREQQARAPRWRASRRARRRTLRPAWRAGSAAARRRARAAPSRAVRRADGARP